MSREIDERVVEMRFDNKQFEQGAGDTLSTLDKLKNALKFDGATKGMDDIEKKAGSIDMGGLGGAIDGVQQKFSALEIVATGALLNIGAKVSDLGIKMAKDLSLDQITAGWTKYNSKNGSVQTIMNSTGKSVDEVNQYLEKLMWFSDETSFSFDAMTSALSQMTNVGGDVEKLIPLLMGLGNATAFAGKGNSEFLTAVTNLTQSYGGGYLNLQDWRSINKTAGVGSKQLVESFIRAGVEMGHIKEGMVDIGNFEESLKEKWVDQEVMEKVFGDFAKLSTDAYDAIQKGMYDTAAEAYEELGAIDGAYDDIIVKASKAAQNAKSFQDAIDATKDFISTGWMTTFELIFGNLDESIELWSGFTEEIYEALAPIGQLRNAVLELWREYGGRGDLFDAISESWEAVKELVGPIKQAWKDIFLPFSDEGKAELKNESNVRWIAQHLGDLTHSFKRAAENVHKYAEDISVYVGNIFKGIFSAVGIAKDFFSAFVDFMPNVGDGLTTLVTKLLETGSDIGEFLVYLREFLKEEGVFTKFFDNVKKHVQPFADQFQIVKDIFKDVYEYFKRNGFFYDQLAATVSPAMTKIREFGKFIDDSFFKVTDKITAALQSLHDFIHNKLLGNGIGELTTTGTGKLVKLSDAFSGVSKGATDLGKVLEDFGIIAKKTNDTVDQNDLGETVKKKYGPVMSILNGLKDVVVGVFKAISHFAPIAGTAFTGIGEGLSKFGKTLSTLFTGDNFKTFLDLAQGTMMVALTANVNKFIKSITKKDDAKGGIFELLGDLVGKITDIGEAISDTLGSLQETLKAKAIKEIGIAIGILAASLWVISTIDPAKLAMSLGAVTSLFAELFGMITALSKVAGGKNLTGVVAAVQALKSIATAVLILAVALNVIAAIDEGKLTSSMVAISVLLGELTGMTVLLSKFGGKIETGAVSIIAFALAIRILAGAVAKFGEMEWEAIGKGLAGVTVLLGAITGFSVLMSKFGGKGLSQAGSMVIMALSLEILVNVVSKFGKMNWESIGKGLAGITGLLGAFVGYSVLMSKFGGKGLSQAMSMVIMALSLELLVNVADKFGKMDWVSIAKGLVGIGVLLGEFVGFSVLMDKFAKGGSSALALLASAVALEMLVNVVERFGKMSIASIAKGLITLALALGVVLGAGAIAGVVAPGLFALAGAVALLGAGMALLGIGVLALSAGLAGLAVSGLAAATSLVAMLEILTVGLINVVKDNIVAIADVVVTFVMVTLQALKAVVPELVGTVLSIIEEVLVSCKDHIPAIVTTLVDLVIGIIDALTEKMPDLMDSIVGLVTSFFASIGAAMKKLDIGTITDFLMGVGVVAAIMLAFAGLSAIAPAAAIGIAEFGGLVTEFMLILALLGALDQIPGFEWLLGEGAGLLELVGKAIGGFFGGIAAGFAEGVSSSFPKIGQDLSDFMTNVQPFIDGASNINESMLSGVKALAEVVLILTAAEILNGLASWLTGSKASIVDFGKELAEFGPYMRQYAWSVEGIDPATVEASANAAKMLAEMAKTLPNNGGLAGLIFGENSLSEFGEELSKFGPYIKKYGESVQGLDAAAIEASVSAATILSDMANNLPNNGGLASLIFGDNTLSDFGEELAAFGPHMAAYGNSIKDIDAEKISASAAVAQMLVDLANALPNTGGIVSWFTGDNDISSFGNSLAAFGSAMNQYYLSISGINVEVMNAVIDGVNDLIDIATRATTIDTSGMERFGSALWTMGDNGIQAFLDGFYNASSDVKLAINTMIQAAIDQINAWQENLDITGKNSATYYENGFYSKFDEIQKHGRLAANKLTEGIKERSEEIKLTGVSTALSFTSGIQTKIDDMTLNLSGIALVTAVISAINLKVPEFNTIGQNIGQGLANGIRSKIAEVEAAARELANAASAASAAALDEHSPSRVFAQQGSFAGEGLVNGMLMWVSEAGKSGTALANAAIVQLSDALNAASDIVTEELGDPTITPVLDLSNVEDDLSTMTDMFNESVSAVASHAVVAVGPVDELQNGVVNGDNSNSKNGNTYNFIQNNSSPKALSRSEIYRQTRNQFAQFTEAVGRA